MLSERQLQAALKVFDERMQDITDDYLRRMGEHIKSIGKLTASDRHRLVQMKRMNANVEAIKRRIAQEMDLSVEDVERVFLATAESDARFMAAIFGEDHTPSIKGNKPLERILKAQLRITGQQLINLSQTTLLSDGYRKAVDVAVSAVQAGYTDYNSAVRSAMRAAAGEGLRVQYPGHGAPNLRFEAPRSQSDLKSLRDSNPRGLTRRLDTAVRQNILDGMRSINQDVLNQLGKEFGADGVELSAHALCAEDHLPYQGRQFSNKEFADLQNSLERKIGAWNCKHTAHPILLGISQPTYSDEELEAFRQNSREEVEIDGRTLTRYEWTQEQRRLETQVRYQKDIANAAKASGDNVLRREAQGRINDLTAQYEKISAKADLLEQRERMGVAGFRKVKTFGELKHQMLRTKDDPIREILGSAFKSHPNEVKAIIDDLQRKGIEIVNRAGTLAYDPALHPGKPGRFIIDPDASYSAWLHEKKHVDDDEAMGWQGMRVFQDPRAVYNMEKRAYDVEIDFAKSLGYTDIVKRLKALKKARREELLHGIRFKEP